MVDQAREWLERLHASNAPEADMALDLLGRLSDAECYDAGTDALQQALEDLEAKLAACEHAIIATDALWVPEGLDHERPAVAVQSLAQCCHDLCCALGADGPEEAIAMARTLREAFE